MNEPTLRFPEFSAEWRSEELAHFIEEYRDQSTAPDQYPVMTSAREGLMLQEEYYENGRMTGRSNVGFNVLPPGYITYRSRSDDRRFFFNENRTGKTGVVSVYYPVFTIRNGDRRFFLYLLRSKVRHIGKFAVGTSQTVLSLNELRRIRLAVPSQDEQAKIAAFLEAVDDKTSALRRKRLEMRRYRSGLMSDLFDKRVRFTRLDGGPFPEWEIKTLGELGTFAGGGTPDTKVSRYWGSDGNPWISSSDLGDGISKISINRWISADALKETPTKVIPKGSVLIVTRVGVGKVAVSPADLCTSQDFSNFTPAKDSAEFIAFWLLANKKALLKLVQGTSIKGVTTDDLRSLAIPLPHVDEQRLIASALMAIDAKVSGLEDQIRSMEKYHKSLFRDMFV